jgi:hypothetical protein
MYVILGPICLPCIQIPSQLARFVRSADQQHTKKHGPTDGLLVTFITPEGEEMDCYAKEDESMLDVAHANDVEMEGACEGSCGGLLAL